MSTDLQVIYHELRASQARRQDVLLAEILGKLEQVINATPSGLKRDRLTEANIILMSVQTGNFTSLEG